MRRFLRGARSHRPVWASAVVREERVLAEAGTGDQWLLATRSRLVVVPDPAAEERPPSYSWPWEQVQAAEWDRESGRLTVSEVGEYAQPRDEVVVSVEDADRLLRVIRERVTASVVLQRRVTVRGRAGFTVIGRRNPAGGPIRWMHEFDPSLDPEDSEVARLADEALAAARDEVGEPI